MIYERAKFFFEPSFLGELRYKGGVWMSDVSDTLPANKVKSFY